METIEFIFPEAGLQGKAVAFTEETFYRFVDDTIRNAEDAADGLLARAVLEPGFDEIEKARRSFPEMPRALADLLCEDAGCSPSAALEDVLNEDTPPGVLRRAGLSAEDAARLIGAATSRLKLVTVRDRDRATLFACVVRTPDDSSLVLLRETRAKRKGFGKASRSASLASIVWASRKPEEVFARYPAIPALILAEKLVEMGDRSAEARFRRG